MIGVREGVPWISPLALCYRAWMPLADVPIFRAVITPHRSLTRTGIAVLIGAFVVLSTGIAVRFWLVGAWPVMAFSLLEVPLVGLLLAINVHRARASELIMLTEHAFTVIRTDAGGRRNQVSLPSAWLRVDLETGRGMARLFVRSHGHACEVGTFLHEPERISLFEALRDALYHARNPRFDNPRLND